MECEHEMDENYYENCDFDDVLRFKEACFKIKCKFCGAKGYCVNDTGNFWIDSDGYLYEG